MRDKPLVVNFAAGPGAGKSTTAAGVFYHLKRAGVRAELVVEFAKDLTYEERWRTLEDQLYVFAKQRRRLARLRGVEVIVTDSPLFLSVVYGTDADVDDLVWGEWRNWNNLTFFIKRNKPYAEFGRTQTEDEARDLDARIYEVCKDFAYVVEDGDDLARDVAVFVRAHLGGSTEPWSS